MAADHILTLARTLDGGGVEAVLLRLARAWVAAGRRVTLVVGDRRGPLAADLAPGIDLVDLDTRSYRDLVAAMPGIVRRTRPDVIFCPGNYYTSSVAWTRLVLGLASPPIVAKMSNAPDRGDHGVLHAIAHRRWLAMHGRFLDALVAMTPATGDTAGRLLRMAGRVQRDPEPAAVRRPGRGTVQQDPRANARWPRRAGGRAARRAETMGPAGRRAAPLTRGRDARDPRRWPDCAPALSTRRARRASAIGSTCPATSPIRGPRWRRRASSR